MENKDLGELSELKFIAKASEKGFQISKPVFNSLPYDLVLDNEKNLYKIQVKSTHFKANTSTSCYTVSVCKGRGRAKVSYKSRDLDFFAVHIAPENLWYIIPFKEVKKAKAISFYPDSVSKWNIYKEKWSLLSGRKNNNG